MVKGAFSPVGRNQLGDTQFQLNFTDELTSWFSTQVKVKVTTGRNRSNRLSRRRSSGDSERSRFGRRNGQFSPEGKNPRAGRFNPFGRRRFGPFADRFGGRKRPAPEMMPEVPSSAPESPSSPVEPVANNGYDIELVFAGDGWANNATLQEAFVSAVDRLESIIVGDLADVQLNGQLIDDLRITAELVDIDGSGGILGQAAPTRLREDSYLPFDGIMRFDAADAVTLFNKGEWDDVILHEMLHVVGFGTIWEPLGLVEGSGTDSPQYVGGNALAAYNDIFGLNSSYIPLETVGGSGTADSHWGETVFDTELMTGYLDSGSGSPLSAITVQSLADLGYQLAPADVLTAATDAYSAPTTVA